MNTTPSASSGRSRGTSNGNARGSSKDRAARRRWLVENWPSDMGPGICRCYRCGLGLTVDTVTVDRIVPGCRGGTYRQDNIRPACAGCNSLTGGAQRGARTSRPEVA